MKGLENQTYLIGIIVSNILALVFLYCAVKWPRIARVLFFLLFTWACWMNWTISQRNPSAYLEYAGMAFSHLYREFITGWFSRNIAWVVGTIATCQGLIALAMLSKGLVFKLGCAAGIIFLLAIVPLGVGSGFPCTIIFAVALIILWQKGTGHIWRKTTLQPA
jgi:hypothetical protein